MCSLREVTWKIGMCVRVGHAVGDRLCPPISGNSGLRACWRWSGVFHLARVFPGGAVENRQDEKCSD